jgi:hypothetical protein
VGQVARPPPDAFLRLIEEHERRLRALESGVRVEASARGQLAYRQLVVDSPAFTLAEIAIPGLEVTYQAEADRIYRILFCGMVFSPVAQDRIQVRIRDGGVSGTVLQAGIRTIVVPGNESLLFSFEGELAAGAHTLTLTANRASGSGACKIVAAPTGPAFLTVEDLGQAP